LGCDKTGSVRAEKIENQKHIWTSETTFQHQDRPESTGYSRIDGADPSVRGDTRTMEMTTARACRLVADDG